MNNVRAKAVFDDERVRIAFTAQQVVARPAGDYVVSVPAFKLKPCGPCRERIVMAGSIDLFDVDQRVPLGFAAAFGQPVAEINVNSR